MIDINELTVGVCGLGLIGGSMAMAYKEAGVRVLGYDIDEETLRYTEENEIIDGILDEKSVSRCDLVLIALYPQKAIEYLESIAPFVDKDCMVIDLCGTKSQVCRRAFEIARSHGFTFIGGHPMAGKQYSGIRHAKASLFMGAPMVLVPSFPCDMAMIERAKELFAPVGFGKISVTDAKTHDEIIAFTSQLAHVVSNAYVKSPTARVHNGFSAGSYKDLTRVAWLNEDMWTELFLENGEPLLCEIDFIIKSLTEYRDAIAEGDAERLRSLLRDGRIAKENIDG